MQPVRATAVSTTPFPEGAVELHPDGRIAAVTVEAERLLGYRSADLIGQPITVILPEDADVSGAVGVQALGEALRAAAGAAWRRRDGTRFSATATVRSAHTADGSGVSVMIHPLVARFDSSWSQHLLDALIGSADEAIAVADRSGRILLWNPATARMLGDLLPQPVGRDRSPGIADLDRRLDGDTFERALRGEHLTLDAYRRIGHGGTVVVSDTRVWPLADSSGEIIGVVWFRREVSEGHQEAALIRTMVRGLSIPMLAVDEAGTIQVVNPALEKLFGYPAKELLGQPVEILVPASLRDMHAGHRRAYMPDPHTRSMCEGLSLRARRKDGSSFPVEIPLSPFATDDGLLVTAAIHDITERLRLAEHEARWAHKVQVTRRMESLGELAGGVAHNFNNLLGVILGSVSFLEEELATLNDQDPSGPLAGALRDVRQIKNAAERGARQTQQLLAFGRRDTVQPRPVDLNDAVTYMQRLLGTTLGPNISLTAVQGQGLRPVMADPGEIEQVLMNLAVNARDAIPGEGTLRLETDNITVDEIYAGSRGISPGQYARIQVTDTGTGMPPQVAERAFEPFYTTRNPSEAQGLGLTTVYAIITNLGGHVAIYSEPGHGTTVTTLLPAIPDPDQPAVPNDTAPPEPIAVDPTRHTVLVVDDEIAIRDIAARILTQAGYAVLIAEHGPAALALAAAHPGPIDLLLTDVVMPQMNGKELAQQLQETRPELAVAFMSGYPQPILTAKGDVDTDATVLQKPFTKADLVTTIADTLTRTART
jgi:PAS domain S-box-containing protein